MAIPLPSVNVMESPYVIVTAFSSLLTFSVSLPVAFVIWKVAETVP